MEHEGGSEVLKGNRTVEQDHGYGDPPQRGIPKQVNDGEEFDLFFFNCEQCLVFISDPGYVLGSQVELLFVNLGYEFQFFKGIFW